MTFRDRQSLTNDVNDDLVVRLRELGRQPIDPVVRHAHWQRIATEGRTTVRSTRRRRLPLVPTVAAAVVAVMAGSTGLAFAGALPDPAQDLVHDVVQPVVGPFGVDMPTSRGRCIADANQLETRDEQAAARAECPHPGKGNEDDDDRDDSTVDDDAVVDPTAPGRSGDAPGHDGTAVPGSNQSNGQGNGNGNGQGNENGNGQGNGNGDENDDTAVDGQGTDNANNGNGQGTNNGTPGNGQDTGNQGNQGQGNQGNQGQGNQGQGNGNTTTTTVALVDATPAPTQVAPGADTGNPGNGNPGNGNQGNGNGQGNNGQGNGSGNGNGQGGQNGNGVGNG